MKADLYFTEKLGYVPVKTGHPRVDGLGSCHGQNGIDGLYRKTDGECVVIEVKSNNGLTSSVGDDDDDDDRQMSDKWLRGHIRLAHPMDQDMLLGGITGERLLINYESRSGGELSSRRLNALGMAISSATRL